MSSKDWTNKIRGTGVATEFLSPFNKVKETVNANDSVNAYADIKDGVTINESIKVDETVSVDVKENIPVDVNEYIKEKINVNVSVDEIINENKDVKAKQLVGIYFDDDVAKMLKKLSAKGSRGAMSKLVNKAVKKLFIEQGYMKDRP